MDNYVVLEWTEAQKYEEMDGWSENSTLINPNSYMGIGYCTYLVNKDWYEQCSSM